MPTDDDLKEMGREVASVMLKGDDAQRPTDQVPIAALMYVCTTRKVEALDKADYGTLAQAMEEALEEAERWRT